MISQFPNHINTCKLQNELNIVNIMYQELELKKKFKKKGIFLSVPVMLQPIRGIMVGMKNSDLQFSLGMVF